MRIHHLQVHLASYHPQVEGELVELQGTGEGRPFTIVEQRALVELCAKGNRELIRKQKELLGDILR